MGELIFFAGSLDFFLVSSAMRELCQIFDNSSSVYLSTSANFLLLWSLIPQVSELKNVISVIYTMYRAQIAV